MSNATMSSARKNRTPFDNLGVDVTAVGQPKGRGKWTVVMAIAMAVALLPTYPVQADSPRVRIGSAHDATIRNGPTGIGSGYVIGNALTKRPGRNGVSFDLLGSSRRGFRYGKIHGNFRLCAWISVNARTTPVKTVPTPRCPGGTNGRVLSPRRFMYALPDGKLLRNCEPGQCKDGSTAAVKPARCTAQYPGGVPVYGNVLPWRPTAVPHDRYATIKARSYKVLWRYVTRDGNWVLARDPHPDNSQARRNAGFHSQDSNWYFIPRACVVDRDGRLH